MKNADRRTFLLHAAALPLLAGAQAVAQTPAPSLEESDPQAAALGYRRNTSTVDVQRFPRHSASQTCGNCQLFQARPSDASGPCPLFAGKQVATAGWCSAWVAKST